MRTECKRKLLRASLLLPIVLFASFGCDTMVGPTKQTTPSDHALSLQYIPAEDESSSPQVNRRALGLLHAKQNALAVFQSPNSPDADRKFASFVIDRTNRQLELEASLLPSDRIAGNARKARYQDFEYQVALEYSGSKNGFVGFLGCGGSLIDASWVLTAAHCLTANIQSSDIQIYLGSAKLSQDGRFVTLAKDGIFRHVNYDPKTDENDIALLKLSSPVTDHQPIDPATTSLEPAMIGFTRIAVISGWGDTQYGASSGSDDMLFANVPLIAHNMCQTDYLNLPPTVRRDIKDGMFCAGSGQADACQGDSGGPLVLRTMDGKVHLEGIVDWGQGCAQKNYPGVYTRVPSYIPWINSCMTGNCQPNSLPPPGPF